MNADDKKGMWIIGLILIILLGSLVATRGCDNTKLKDDNQEPEIVNPEPTPTISPEEEIIEDIVDEEDSYVSNLVTKEEAEHYQPSQVVKPTIDLSKYLADIKEEYLAEVGYEFVVPMLSTPDNINWNVRYFFKELYSNTYNQVLGFNTLVPGTYKVVYTVSDGENSLEKESVIEVQDTEAPVIEGFTENYDPTTGITTYEPVGSNQRINKTVQISFSDNHEVVYAEYYKAKYEFINGEETIEQEGMQEIIEVDLTQNLILYEDGEYYVRAYDMSGNAEEYVVIIDRTNPIVSVSYSRIDKDTTLVTITSEEIIQPLLGWQLSDDQLHLSKEYANAQQENIIISDLAGNNSSVQVTTDTVEVIWTIKQAGNETTSINLNTQDGEVTVSVNTNPIMEINYYLDEQTVIVYNGETLTEAGHYTFQALLNGKVMDTLELDVSNVVVGD